MKMLPLNTCFSSANLSHEHLSSLVVVTTMTKKFAPRDHALVFNEAVISENITLHVPPGAPFINMV